jgi:hypothetical protein
VSSSRIVIIFRIKGGLGNQLFCYTSRPIYCFQTVKIN